MAMKTPTACHMAKLYSQASVQSLVSTTDNTVFLLKDAHVHVSMMPELYCSSANLSKFCKPFLFFLFSSIDF